jgi:hypothetical protein
MLLERLLTASLVVTSKAGWHDVVMDNAKREAQ